MGEIKTFKDIIAWQKAHGLVLFVYRVSKTFPKSEEFGLISQMRRAAVSIAANLAEGYRRRHKNDRLHFYNIAETSLEELKYESLLAKDLEFIDSNQYSELLQKEEETGKVLRGWIVSRR